MAGKPDAFNVTASGAPPLAYQWRFKGTDILGATNSSYTVGSARNTNVGLYAVTVTNFVGTNLSPDASLSVVILGASGDNSWGQTSFPLSSNLVAIAAGALRQPPFRPLSPPAPVG